MVITVCVAICYWPTLVANNYTWWTVQYGWFYMKHRYAVSRR